MSAATSGAGWRHRSSAMAASFARRRPTPTAGYFTGGAQVGYNYQFGNGLVGVEADVNGNSNFKGGILGTDDDPAIRVKSNMDVSGTIRAPRASSAAIPRVSTPAGPPWGRSLRRAM